MSDSVPSDERYIYLALQEITGKEFTDDLDRWQYMAAIPPDTLSRVARRAAEMKVEDRKAQEAKAS